MSDRSCGGPGLRRQRSGSAQPWMLRLMPQPCELALDPATPPAWILAGQPQHQVSDRLRVRWPARPAPARAVVPLARDKPSMPLEQGARSHWEHPRPAPPGYQRGQRCEPQPVRRPVAHRTRQLSTQHGVLVPKDKKSGSFGIASSTVPARVSHCRERYPLRRLTRSSLTCPYPALHIASAWPTSTHR